MKETEWLLTAEKRPDGNSLWKRQPRAFVSDIAKGSYIPISTAMSSNAIG